MDEVITRISEHEGGAMDHCHHQANSWRLKPLQQLGDYIHTPAPTHTQTLEHSPQELSSPILKRVWSCDNWRHGQPTTTLCLLSWALRKESNEHTRSSLCPAVHIVIKTVWECDLPHALPFSCVFKMLTSLSLSFILLHVENRDINGAGKPTVWVIILLFP